MKYILILLFGMIFSNIVYATTPSQAIHAHPLDQYGNWTGVENQSEFFVGETVQFHNPYKEPYWQQDGWAIKDLQTNQFLGCVPLFSADAYPQCTMIFWENGRQVSDSCDDANQKRSFDKPGTYQITVMSTGPGYCGAPIVSKNITITPIKDFAWLVPVITLVLH